MLMSTRIALIHAVAVAMEPIEQAFAELWPQTERVNIFDDSLSPDRAKDANLTPAMFKRILDLGDYALSLGARGILYTCSAFGPAIEAMASRTAVPVLKPNQAMFEEALSLGSRIGMVATFKPSVASMEEEFAQIAALLNPRATLITALCEPAMQALKDGDAAAHNQLVAEAAASVQDADVMLMAHFSTSRAALATRKVFAGPVLTATGSAVLALKKRLCD